MVISWKERQAEAEGEGDLGIESRAYGARRDGKGGIVAEVSPSPIYCLWLFCDEIEGRSKSPAILVSSEIQSLPNVLILHTRKTVEECGLTHNYDISGHVRIECFKNRLAIHIHLTDPEFR